MARVIIRRQIEWHDEEDLVHRIVVSDSGPEFAWWIWYFGYHDEDNPFAKNHQAPRAWEPC